MVPYDKRTVPIMKAERPYPQIAITPKGEAALTGGHPWVYEGEVTSISGALPTATWWTW